MNFLKNIFVIGTLLIIFIAGCQNQVKEEAKTVKIGSVVLVDYAGGFLNGTLFDTKTARIPPEKGYGFYNEDSVNVIPLSEFGNQTGNIKEGARLIMVSPQGRVPVLIKKVGKENVTIDFNHPLANQTLVFAILVREVN